MDEHDGKWATATLRVASQTKTVEDITHTVGIAPTSVRRQGEPVTYRHPNAPLRSEPIWLLESGLGESEPLERHIGRLLDHVERNLSGFKQLSSDCSVEIRCAFSSANGQGGLVLDADLLRRLTMLPIDLVIDLFPGAA